MRHASSWRRRWQKANRAAAAVGARESDTSTASASAVSRPQAPQAVEWIEANNPNIAYCEQDQVVTVVPVQTRGGGVSGTAVQPAQGTPWGIVRVGGGASGTFVTAWVIDTGLDVTHPDLNVDTARSGSLNRDTSPADPTRTVMARTSPAPSRPETTASASSASRPGAPVVAVRVLDRRGSGSNSGVIAGVDYVAANGWAGDDANMRLGGGISTAVDTAVVNAAARGVRFALAAGNESDNANNHSPGAPSEPTSSPCRRPRSATSGRDSRTTATRPLTPPSSACRSSRPA